jgi:hypothetical protein
MTIRVRRWVGAAVLAAAATFIAVGATGCGSSDNGGVIQGPTTTAGSNRPGY